MQIGRMNLNFRRSGKLCVNWRIVLVLISPVRTWHFCPPIGTPASIKRNKIVPPLPAMTVWHPRRGALAVWFGAPALLPQQPQWIELEKLQAIPSSHRKSSQGKKLFSSPYHSLFHPENVKPVYSYKFWTPSYLYKGCTFLCHCKMILNPCIPLVH